MTDLDTAHQDPKTGHGASGGTSNGNSPEGSTGSKKSIYRIAAVLGVIAVSLYVLSILSLVFSRGALG